MKETLDEITDQIEDEASLFKYCCIGNDYKETINFARYHFLDKIYPDVESLDDVSFESDYEFLREYFCTKTKFITVEKKQSRLSIKVFNNNSMHNNLDYSSNTKHINLSKMSNLRYDKIAAKDEDE